MTSAATRFLAHIARVRSVGDAITTRKSVQKFLKTPISKDVMENILNSASSTPSGDHLQQWKVYVVSGQKKKALIDAVDCQLDKGIISEENEYHLYPHHDVPEQFLSGGLTLDHDIFKNVGHTHAVEQQQSTMNQLREIIDSKEKYKQVTHLSSKGEQVAMNHLRESWKFFGAPVGLIFTIERQMKQGQFVDLGMFMQNIMLLAREQGLHTCPHNSWATWNRTVRQILHIPSDELVFCGMSIGYADFSHPSNKLKTDRDKLEEFVTYYFDDELYSEKQRQVARL